MDDEVMRALNTLKRAGKIDSILFYEITSYSYYLPDISAVLIRANRSPEGYEEPGNAFVSIKFRECWDSIDMKDEQSAKAFREQWKLAKMAVAFL